MQTLVDEVGGFQGPALWQLVSLDLHLFCEYHISDLFPAAANVRPASEHELITDDSHSKVVHCEAMVLTAHHFRGHIAWCSRSVGAVICAEHFGDSHVGNSNVPIFFHDDVFRLDVSMNDPLIMHILES